MEKHSSYTQDGFIGLISMLVVVAVIAIVAGGWYAGRTTEPEQPQPDASQGILPQPSASSPQGLLNIGLQKEKEAEALKQQIEEQQKRAQEILDEKSPASVDVSKWKTHRNEKYGFEVKYPADWERAVNSESILLEDKENKSAQISFIALARYKGKKFEDLPTFEPYSRNINFKEHCKSILISGMKAYDCNPAFSDNNRTIIISRDDAIFEINDKVQSDISRTILASFSFLK